MKLTLKQRLVVALAAVILLPVFITPLWSISLFAPQYPDGMGMYIGVSEVRGHNEHDIQNINILNHYIGMKPIDPDGIPELDIFPPILAAIIVIGLIAAAVGRRWLVTGWLVGFVGLAVAGMVDFYLWLIDYGHNLDPMAAIKIPGMTYTPPLIGTKQLLNITAGSFPHIGTLFLTVSIGLGAWVVYTSFRRRTGGHVPSPEGETDARPRPSVPVGVSVAALAVVLLLSGCGGQAAEPSAVAAVSSDDRMVYGETTDPYCGEVVQRVRWGGEIRTAGGETLRFRSVECMAAYLLEERTPGEQVVEVRAVDFPHGWRLIDVHGAYFLHTPNLASPARRNLNVMAISTEKMASNLQDAYTGPLLGWEEVLAVVANEWQIGPVLSARNN